MGSTAQSTALFKPMTLGKHTLSHRIVMAPLTRYRSTAEHVPLPMVATYYSQRASVPGTLLITEATLISHRAGGMNNVPGIWNEEQIAAWKNVVDAVHAKGSRIFCQIWALGRAAIPKVAREKDIRVVSSSAVPISENQDEHARPTPLTEDEIWEYVKDYATAAKNAVYGAGFDGVEIHGANGYLVDQFTKDTSNRRTDKWGGNAENRSRFAVEVAKAVVEAVGADRTAIRLSPWGTGSGMGMADPVPQFTDLIKRLKELKLAYLHFLWRSHKDPSLRPDDQIQWAVDMWDNQSPVIVCGWLTPESAKTTVDETFKGKNVGIAFGRSFMANPDLVFRIQNELELKESDKNDWYRVMSSKGYTDEPFSEEWLRLHPQHQDVKA